MRQTPAIAKPYRQAALAIGLFTFLTVFMTWPLAVQAGSSVIGWVGDNVYFVWLVGWFQKALFELHRLPLSVPQLNYPEGWNLAYNEITAAMVLAALPASLVGGPVLGYNFSIFLSFVLSGLGVYLWVHRLTGNFTAGLIAGSIFAFAPYRLSHLVGHFNLMGTQWFAFYFLSLNDLLENRKPVGKLVVMAALFLCLISLTSQYYLYMTLVLSLVYISGYWLLVDHRLVFRPGFWGRLAAMGLVSLPLVVIAILPYLLLNSQGVIPVRTLDDIRIWSASPTDFILPSPQHFLWGDKVHWSFDRRLWVENTLYLGGVSLALAGLALARRRPAARLMAFTALIAFILALGTNLHWLGQPIIVDVPQFFQRWYHYQQTYIPLPNHFLFKFLPFYSGMRVWMRYGIFVMLFTSLLAGLGAAWLLEWLKPRWVAPAAAVILLLVMVDFYTGPVFLSPVSARRVDHWLASQPGQGVVAEYPLPLQGRSAQVYSTLSHGKPFLGTFFAAYTTPQFQRIAPVLAGFPDKESLELLRELGVEWVLVDSSRYENFLLMEGAIRSMGLRPVVVLDGHSVYHLPPAIKQ